jgi:uncharacterized membrane protein YqjE
LKVTRNTHTLWHMKKFSIARIIQWIGIAMMIAGFVLIASAKQIAIWQHGEAYGFADIGNMLLGMVIGAIGFIVTLGATIARRIWG